MGCSGLWLLQTLSQCYVFIWPHVWKVSLEIDHAQGEASDPVLQCENAPPWPLVHGSSIVPQRPALNKLEYLRLYPQYLCLAGNY